MATTIGETISRVRNIVKGVKEDAFLTDRFLYSLIIKYANLLMRRQDNENKIFRIQSLFKSLPCLDLIEVSKIEACCGGIITNCTIMRTKERIPEPMEGAVGPLIRSVSSLDGSIVLVNVNPGTYTIIANQSTFKYNKSKYYWYLDGHLYFPNLEWEGVRVDAIFAESTRAFECDADLCAPRQDDRLPIPDFLFAEVEQMVLKELGFMIQTPVETQDDKQSPLRS
jgi:hypothetical protein